MTQSGAISEVRTRSVTRVFDERDAARRAELTTGTDVALVQDGVVTTMWTLLGA